MPMNKRRIKKWRHEVWKTYGRKCFVCCSRRKVQIHHWTYERYKSEKVGDVFPLCEVCHKELHKEILRRKIKLSAVREQMVAIFRLPGTQIEALIEKLSPKTKNTDKIKRPEKPKMVIMEYGMIKNNKNKKSLRDQFSRVRRQQLTKRCSICKQLSNFDICEDCEEAQAYLV